MDYTPYYGSLLTVKVIRIIFRALYIALVPFTQHRLRFSTPRDRRTYYLEEQECRLLELSHFEFDLQLQ
jgi:hypothetical protein